MSTSLYETFGSEITGNANSIINQNISNQRFQANDITVIIKIVKRYCAQYPEECEQ